MSFADTGLSEDVLRAVTDSGYDTPTPIQEKAIPTVLMGRDILGCAQTGTGKTASFTLPMIDILAHGRAKMRMPRSLILEPTRELATQVAENFDKYGKYHKLNKALLIGGTDMKAQSKVLDAGADVLIATPGRLLDMFERGHLLMRDVKILVIDEADRMLDMGFIPDIEKIVSMLPPLRQTLFFSATMAPEIKKLADKFLMNPKEITVAAPATTADTVTQGLAIVKPGPMHRGMDGKKKLKRDALRAMIAHEDVQDAIVFCNRKADVNIVYKSLSKHGYKAGQLHGDMSQPARTEMLQQFKAKEFNILVCSDVAARGLDIPNLSHVFNYDVPINAEDYVHRIGRTGRAGNKGHAYSIALPEDGKFVKQIEELTSNEIPRIDIEGFDGGELSEKDERGGRGRGRGRGDRGDRGERKEGRGRGRGRGRDKRDDKPAEDKSAEAPAAATAETKTEAPEAKSEQPVEKKERAPRKSNDKRDNKREGSRDRSRGGARGRHKKSTERRIREIHNEICDGHMPAFLMNPPDVAEEKSEKKKAPAKRRPRRKSSAKKAAAKAED